MKTVTMALTAQMYQSGYRFFDTLLKRRLYHRFRTSQFSGMILGVIPLTDQESSNMA